MEVSLKELTEHDLNSTSDFNLLSSDPQASTLEFGDGVGELLNNLSGSIKDDEESLPQMTHDQRNDLQPPPQQLVESQYGNKVKPIEAVEDLDGPITAGELRRMMDDRDYRSLFYLLVSNYFTSLNIDKT